jgi:hypothetical protein
VPEFAARELALNGHRPPRSVDVAPFESDPLLGSQTRPGSEHDHGSVQLVELMFDRVNLIRTVERAQLDRPRLRVATGVDGRVAADIAPTDGGTERLACRRAEPVARRLSSSARAVPVASPGQPHS